MSPADSTIAIIDLLIKIVANHHPLFSPADLTRVVVPILEYFWSGITASSTPTDEQPSPVPTETGRGSLVSGPSPTLRRSVMSSGSRKDTSSYLGTPTPQSGIASPPSTVSSISRSLLPEKEPVLDPKWTRALPAFCTFVEMLVRVAALSDDLFEHIVTFLCFCFGQDDVDRMPISGWEVTQTLLKAILGPEGGRRGELIVRNVLEGKGVKGSRAKLPEADRKVTRGAVM